MMIKNLKKLKKEARNEDGSFKRDDPTTPENEPLGGN